MSIKQTNLRILLFSLLLFILPYTFGQEKTVSGKIIDPTGEPLPGVNVVVKGTTKGVVSDMNGMYQISAPAGSTLVFSYVGYLSQEIVVDETKSLDITLTADIANLEEVVVIGYGTVKKSDATGAVATVSARDFNKGAITSPQELLVGKSAGVVITTSGGAPGSGSTIRIRGGSSLRASNDPLIIIDGVPIDNNNVAGSSNFLSFVNPNDIESVSVLKDASATAIYGSRASNGVILITTKKGKVGSKLRVNYDGSVSIASPMKYVDVYSGDEIRKIALDHRDLFGVDSYSKLGSQNTNWQKEIYRVATSHDHNLSVSGAYKSLPYRASIGYTDQNGILVNTDMQRITGTLSLNPSFLNNTLKVNVNAKAMNTNNNFGDNGAVGSAIYMDPSQLVKDGNATTNGYFQWSNYGANLGTANPVSQALDIDNTAEVNRFIGNIQLDYQLPFLTDMRANLNLATDYTKSDGNNNRPTTTPTVLINPLVWGRLEDFSAENKNNLLEFYLNYNKDIQSIKSKIDATAGYSWQHFELENDRYVRGVQDAEHSYQRTDSTGKINELYLVSFFGRLNYTLMDKYLFTFTLRNDGSSRFAEDNRWGIFPSAALAWKLKEESFLKNVNFVSDLKIRMGWGITGQQDIGDRYYPYMTLYRSSAEGSYYMIDNQYLPTLRPDAYDPNIKWEETTTLNLGLDFSFLKDRISGTFDLYKRTTEDLLNSVTIPTGSNFSNTLYTNVGSLENRGFELSLNVIPVSTQDMSLNLGFNLTYNKNEITKLLMSDDPNFVGILYGDAMTGQKQVTRVGEPAHSFFVNKQVYDKNGNPIEGLYEDLSGKGGVVNGDNADKYIFHNPSPDYLLGFSARFSYKNFDISANTRASIGNYVYNQVVAGASYDQMYQIGYWHNQTKLLDDTKFVKRQFTSDYFVENGSFFKLDNISAGYRFENIFEKVSARISFTVQNVFTITKYSGLDPEVPYSDVSGSNVPGIDNNFYPRARTFMVGVSLGF